MNKIYTLKDYNAKAYNRYLVAVNKAVRDKENVPAMSKYIFDKTTGYIVVVNDQPKYFSDKKRAIEYLIKIESDK